MVQLKAMYYGCTPLDPFLDERLSCTSKPSAQERQTFVPHSLNCIAFHGCLPRTIASPGPCWPLASPGLCWPLLASPGLCWPLSWPLLASPGPCWPLLAPAGLPWPLLASSGPGQFLPAPAGLPWPLLASLLASAGVFWPLLASPGHCWPVLASAGLSSPLLASPGQRTDLYRILTGSRLSHSLMLSLLQVSVPLLLQLHTLPRRPRNNFQRTHTHIAKSYVKM